MIKLVREITLLYGVRYHGYIQTDLSVPEFLLRVLLSVGFELEDAESDLKYLEENELLTELYLTADGFWFNGTPGEDTTKHINLVLRKDRTWLVDDFGFEQLEQFVAKLQ